MKTVGLPAVFFVFLTEVLCLVYKERTPYFCKRDEVSSGTNDGRKMMTGEKPQKKTTVEIEGKGSVTLSGDVGEVLIGVVNFMQGKSTGDPAVMYVGSEVKLSVNFWSSNHQKIGGLADRDFTLKSPLNMQTFQSQVQAQLFKVHAEFNANPKNQQIGKSKSLTLREESEKQRSLLPESEDSDFKKMARTRGY